MAIDSAHYPGTLDRSSYQYVDNYLNIWEAMAEPANRLMLLDMIPQGEDLEDRTYYVTEDNATTANYVTAAEAVDSSETEIDLATDEELRLQVGDLLHQYHNAKTEWLQVTAIDTTNHRITVSRNVGSQGASSFDNASQFRIVRLRNEGSEKDIAEFKGTNRVYNYTGIISHTVELSDTAGAGTPRAPYGAELDRQEAEVLTNWKFELETLFAYGPGVAPSTSAYGALLGLRGNIVAGGGSNYISSGDYNWSHKLISNDLNWLAKQGFVKPTSNVVIFGPADMATTAADWKASQVQYEVSDRTYGLEVPVLVSALGIRAPLLWSPDAKTDEYMILNLDRIRKHPMAGRALIRMRKPAFIDLQDWEGRRLLGEWGLTMGYRTKAHFLRTGVTFDES